MTLPIEDPLIECAYCHEQYHQHELKRCKFEIDGYPHNCHWIDDYNKLIE